jgi:hypothetical protein
MIQSQKYLSLTLTIEIFIKMIPSLKTSFQVPIFLTKFTIIILFLSFYRILWDLKEKSL